MDRAEIKTIAGLTLKQEAFANHWVLTRNSAASYKKAYNVENTKDESLARMGFDVRHNPVVADRILDIMAGVFKKAKITPKMIEEKLWEEASLAESDGARATNLKTLGRVHAMLTQKHEIEEQSLSDVDLAMSIACAGYEQPPETPKELTEIDQEGYNWVISKLSL